MPLPFLQGFVEGLRALGINLPSLLAQLINFTILLVVLYFLAYKPALRYLDERRRRIQEGLEASEEAKRRLARTEEEVQAQLERARQEGQALVAQAQQVANRIQEEARAQARREAEQLLARARSEIQLERDAAIAELRREFADLTIRAAERVIRQSLDREAHRRLIEETLAQAALPDGGGGDRTG
ncbi:ATP synthase subunit b [bacterium HR25]|jgi:F-type H+-transporting ATPase subunit b|nr:ATP synthase subunit b [bacterium HR25]